MEGSIQIKIIYQLQPMGNAKCVIYIEDKVFFFKTEKMIFSKNIY